MTGETSRGRMPALDALRGAAVLLVVAAHVGLPGFRWGGQVGVAVFFTLSGYLITGILLRGQPLRVFYVRRAARLLPALVVLLAVELAVTREPRHVVAAAAYVSNWWAVAGGAPSAISHTWSLAVEEQFYALWPLLFVAAARGRRLEVAIAALAAWRVIAWRTGWEAEVEWGTVSNALGLMAGAWLAIHQPKPRRWMLPAGTAALAATFVATGTAPAVGFLVLVPAAIAATALIITDHHRAAPRALCWFGGISYGWYLWHQFFINTWGHSASMGERGFLAVCGLAVAVASLHLLERPAQRWINASCAQTPALVTALKPRSSVPLCSRAAHATAASPSRR